MGVRVGYVGLGSNLGDRRRNIERAVEALGRARGVRVRRVSPVVETEPVGGPRGQQDYLNGVVEISTALSPEALLKVLKGIERSLGRGPARVRWAPRTIDLDLLALGSRVVRRPGLQVPHARLAERRFVLEPWAHLRPSWRHPLLKRTVSELLCEQKGPASLKIHTRPHVLRKDLERERCRGRSIGFVPTMGALHEGHLALIRRARRECDIVVVSIFINPLQFGPREDFRRYPRDLARDIRLIRPYVDHLFVPRAKDFTPSGRRTSVQVAGLSDVLCGASRPGHFTGVATIVVKLFNVVGPSRVYFGQKDAQQALIIRTMVRDLDIPVKVVVHPIVREEDGLAMSSRNRYLSADERREAAGFSRALSSARELVDQGVRSTSLVRERVVRWIASIPGARVDYVEIVDPRTLRPVRVIKGEALLAAAVCIGKTRLIDNIILRAKGRQKASRGVRRRLR